MTSPTAAVLIIGDEVLSGRTQDTNLNTIARFLGALGIDLMEARTVGDRTEQIVDSLNALRTAHDYVFTTGGIGPTHDDITADAVRFVGGIDDRPTNKPEDLDGANNHVRAALADMEAGRPVQTAFATPYGCSIKYPETVEG